MSRRTDRKGRAPLPPSAPPGPGWTFLSNHAHVLVVLARAGEPTVREVSQRVGITERAVHKILGELEQAGYLERRREGRRNLYRVSLDLPLRHPLEAQRTIGDLIDAVGGTGAKAQKR